MQTVEYGGARKEYSPWFGRGLFRLLGRKYMPNMRNMLRKILHQVILLGRNLKNSLTA